MKPGISAILGTAIRCAAYSVGSDVVTLALLWQVVVIGVHQEVLTARAPQGWRSCEEVEDRLSDGRHAGLRWRSSDFFRPAALAFILKGYVANVVLIGIPHVPLQHGSWQSARAIRTGLQVGYSVDVVINFARCGAPFQL